MKILLTGHKGYVGRHLYAELKNSDNVAGFDQGKNWAKWLQKFMKRISPPHSEVIIHCGGNPDSTYTDPDIYQWNYEATRRIADFAANCNAHLIFFSSSCAIRPDSHYGWSKRAAEDFIRSRMNGRYTLLRIFNIYGKEEHRNPINFSVPQKLVDHTLKELYVPLTRDYIHVDDVVSAVRYVIEESIFGTYEVGTGIPTQVRDLGNLIGWKPETVCRAPESIPEYKIAAQANFLPGFRCKHNIMEELPKLSPLDPFVTNESTPVWSARGES